MAINIEEQIVSVASEMLSGRIGLVEGSRLLVKLSGRLENCDSALFTPIVAFESETEAIPAGELRALWEPGALARLERNAEGYIADMKGEILETCRAILQRYGSQDENRNR